MHHISFDRFIPYNIENFIINYDGSKDKRWGITVGNCTETWDLTDSKAEPKLTSTLPEADTTESQK
jgi:hypothetical protein